MKLMFLPMDGHGHVNSCIGLARMLKDHGHESVFVVAKNWNVLITGHSFTVENISDPENDPDQDPLSRWVEVIQKTAPSFTKPPTEQVKEFFAADTKDFVNFAKRIDDQVAIVIDKVKPDLIVVDFYVTVPAVVKSDVPWTLLYSANPLFAYESPNSPPRYSGLGPSDDPKLFQEFRDLVSQELAEVKADFDEFIKSKGLIPVPHHLVQLSPYLNLYSYPSDIDYSELGPVPEKWFRLDHVVREAEDKPYGFDESFLETKEKIVLFSLGSMGSADLVLMKRLIGFLGDSKHRFIVAKGHFHDHITLPENMVGSRYLNQIKILPRVDMVITHGGNNTFIEALYFGKPCIVLPLFGDQHDNGRRAIDKKIGKSFSPYHVTKEQLLSSIEEILNDKEMVERAKTIGENVRNSRSHQRLSEKLIQLVDEDKKAKSAAQTVLIMDPRTEIETDSRIAAHTTKAD